ncbi:SRPBCC domain-containing protein [Schumannella sp. 10F1B-5-1]|uniref:SRPBCC family protein n=1 Tax=Schumannella sp. 10F1B-5-1 TaxID=2590780 RepID=UPI0011313151|nr:SRPBCC domain-containing protein [Schumannella sp. 10F1B-5-1]TPW73751.1 hypothetical protein FJ658_03790 [Schumannella sp. 10F1B-5-1]
MTTTRHIEVVRILPDDIDRVWAALSTSDGMRGWWWRHWNGVRIRFEAGVDADYAIAAPEQGIELTGRFTRVAHPEHLDFTWCWRDADGAEPEEQVEITLAAHGGDDGDGVERTELRVRHGGPWSDDEPGARNRQGWEFTLDQLVAMLEGR